MARDVVQVQGVVPAAPDAVWSVVRDFCGAWHPWVTSMREERGPQGARVRAFAVAGEDTLYREQQTYLSDSDRVLGYTHLQGIAGCEAYDARLTVTPSEAGGSSIGWTATVRASAARLGPICEGTRAVYKAGIAALAGATLTERQAPALPAPVPVETLILDALPRLALTVTPDRGDGRLCLFLHGIGGGRSNWLPQLQAAGSVMRAAALDLRGYGDSTLGPRQSGVDDYCADILRVAERLGAARLVLIGPSMPIRHGGRLAISGNSWSRGILGLTSSGLPVSFTP